MTKPFATEYPPPSPKDRIIAALDVATLAEARRLVDELAGSVGAFKIGSQLFTAAGPGLVSELVGKGLKVFLDLKFHDIPNTVARAAVEAARLGVWMLNVHTLGGRTMMRRTADEVRIVCEKENIGRPFVIGVTVLTSSGADELTEVGIEGGVEAAVSRLAGLAAESGLDGVVASPQEVNLIRRAVPRPGFLIITPGIRLNAATNDDQRRVTTFMQAIQHGSDYVVIGRPILEADDRRAAVDRILAEVGSDA